MSIVRRIQGIARAHGLRGVATKVAGAVRDYAFAWRYGVETQAIVKLEELTIRAGSLEHANYYEGSRIMPLRGIMTALREMEPRGGVLVDLGCGKGKVLLAAAESGMSQVRGVEFAHELCESARANWRSYQAKTRSTCNVEIIEADAALYEVRPDETMFFLFNPFDAQTLAKVLSNVAASVCAHPRNIFFAVAFPSESYRRAFEQSLFRPVREVVAWACRFSVYSNASVSFS